MYIVVPTDFSSNAYNCGYFASAMLKGQYDATLLLYHVYEKGEDREKAEAQMQLMKNKLLEESLIKIETEAEHGDDLVESLEKKLRHIDAALLVIGISEKSRMEQMFSGSNSVKLIEKNICPVLVVPYNARFSEINNVALACDFKEDVESSIPLLPVKRVLTIFKPQVHVVNINSEIYVSLTEEMLAQRAKLVEMFSEFSPEFYFITTYDFHETLLQFIQDKKIDMVLTFPRKHSFLDNLLKGSNTRKLVYESSIPVLAAHE